jgi:AAA domain
MSANGFSRATKQSAKFRGAFFGPSGAGKTFTTLRVGKGLARGGRIGLIDTERGSASKYADQFDFDVLELADKSIDGYCHAITMAAAAGFAVLIIDSMSHAWDALQEHVDQLARTKYRGNTWSAWSEGSPLQRKFIDAILSFPGHILVTMRSKTEWKTTESGGKSKPERVGLAPMQRAGTEYEFDFLIELTTEHLATCIKDRTGRWQDKIIDKPGEALGESLADWLSQGAAPADPLAATLESIRSATAKGLDSLAPKIQARLESGSISEAQAATLLTAMADRRREVANA